MHIMKICLEMILEALGPKKISSLAWLKCCQGLAANCFAKLMTGKWTRNEKTEDYIVSNTKSSVTALLADHRVQSPA